jgi:DNA-binding response OmpR family regulator
MRTRILLADADAPLRTLYAAYLDEVAFHVATAADGLECLALLRATGAAACVYYLKPLEPVLLAEAIRELLRKQSAREQPKPVVKKRLTRGKWRSAP